MPRVVVRVAGSPEEAEARALQLLHDLGYKEAGRGAGRNVLKSGGQPVAGAAFPPHRVRLLVRPAGGRAEVWVEVQAAWQHGAVRMRDLLHLMEEALRAAFGADAEAGGAPWLSARDGGTLLRVHVRPGASSAGVVGADEFREVLVLRVTERARGGAANEAVCALVAQALGLPRAAVSVHVGARGRDKVLFAAGVDPETVRRALEAPG